MPAPDSSSRHPPESLFVMTTASPFIESCVVRSPATVSYAGTGCPSPTFNRKALPLSAGMFIPPEKAVQSSGEGRRAKPHHALIDADRVKHQQTAAQSKAHQEVTADVAGQATKCIFDKP